MAILLGSFTHFVPRDVRSAPCYEPGGFEYSDPAFLKDYQAEEIRTSLKKLRPMSRQRSVQMNDHEPICRICFDADTETGQGLISPCMCKGTQQFVHRSCLDQWRTHGDPFALYYCPTCKARYHLRAKFMKSYSWYRMKYYIHLAGDALFSFIAFLTMVSVLGVLAALVDRMQMLNVHPAVYSYCLGLCAMIEEHAFFRDAVGYFLYEYDFVIWFPALREVLFDAIITIVAFSGTAFLIIIMSAEMMRIKMIHRNLFIEDLIKAMREYVVVDLHGHYTPPGVDDDDELVWELTQGLMRM